MIHVDEHVSIGQWLESATVQLRAAGDSARVDAEYILAAALDKERSYFFTWPEKILSSNDLKQANAFLARRARGEPIAYILGERAFWSLNLFCDASTLIPRADTEIVVENILALDLPKQARILDLGTGTGAIALALATERSDFWVDAVDNSQAAVLLATKNKKRHKISNVEIFLSDWFERVQGTYDLIVSNPPYIDKEDEHLDLGDLRFEPRSALVAADKGLADIRHIIHSSYKYLNTQGFLVLEHGWKQRNAVQLVFREAGFSAVKTWKDYGGNDRASLAQLCGKTQNER